jgi:putative membrane protein
VPTIRFRSSIFRTMTFLIKLLVWLLRILVFIGLFGLAIKNSGPMELRFFLDQSWTAPVSVVILAVFAVGVAVGLTAALGVFLRPSSRREH